MLRSLYRLAVNSRFNKYIPKMSSAELAVEQTSVESSNASELASESKDSNIGTKVDDATRLAAEKYVSARALKQQQKNEMKAQRKRELKERRAKVKENKEVGFNLNESLKQTDYYFENGLRKVYPYMFYWNTTAKERWFGRTLFNVYSQEFARAIMNQPLEKLILTGKIKVNGQTKALDYVIKNGDMISHSKHRHEIPVLGVKLKVVHEDDDYLVIDKPSSIPMHPCGKYRYNSIQIILAKELEYRNLRTLYRLDRLTSGCVILGKNFQAALVLDKHIKERTAVKTYLSRVVGEFPEGRIAVDKPIDCASRKIGLYWIDEKNGKECLTEFERVSFNGHTSVVKCWPKTGRTHQIRIHLQYLGYPIVNDPLYNQPTLWGPGNGKLGKYEYNKEEIEQNFLKVHTYEAWIIKQEQEPEEKNEKEKVVATTFSDKSDSKVEAQEVVSSEMEDKVPLASGHKRKVDDEQEKSSLLEGHQKNDDNGETLVKKAKEDSDSIEQEKPDGVATTAGDSEWPGFEPSRVVHDPECFECSQKYRDPEPADLIMYLHALSYKFGDHEFKTDMPEWAKEDFKE